MGRRASHGAANASRAGNTRTLTAAMVALMLAGSLYGLWELTAGLDGPSQAPVTRSGPAREPGAGAQAGEASLAGGIDPTGASRQVQGGPKTARGPQGRQGTGVEGQGNVPAGPELRSELARVATTFRSATPDLRGLNELVRGLAQRCTILEPSVQETEGARTGRIQLDDTDLEATFEVRDDLYRIDFVENSFETVRPPFVHLELTIEFRTPRRSLSDARARLAFAPNHERRAAQHVKPGETLILGWDVHFKPNGAEGRAIEARPASDLAQWDEGPTNRTRRDNRVRDLSSFQGWRVTLAAAR